MTRAPQNISFAAALAVIGLCAAGCPETLQAQCPTGSTTVGGFTLKFSPVSSADACLVVLAPDGGALDGAVSATPPDTAATLCASGDDGGTIVLLVANQQSRKSTVDDGGNFTFTSAALNISGTQCNCPVDINETLAGQLVGKDGGFATFDADGGLSPVGNIDAGLVDAVTVTDAGAGVDAGICRCNTPCALRYGINGVPF